MGLKKPADASDEAGGKGDSPLAETPSSAKAGGDKAEVRRLSPGLGALLKGGNGDKEAYGQTGKNNPKSAENDEPEDEEDAEEKASKDRHRQTMRISLVVADLLLVALAAKLVFGAHARMGTPEVVLCVLALGMGAWLSCAAILRR